MWAEGKVYGRDEILAHIKARAETYRDSVVQDVLNVMKDYEVDLYRFVLAVGERYGRDTAFEIMSDTVAAKRLRWLEQNWDNLEHRGTDLDRGLDLFIKYFKLTEGAFHILKRKEGSVVLKRMDPVGVIAHACDALALDVVEVSNKIYARATNLMLERINPGLRHVVTGYLEGWYEERIELAEVSGGQRARQ